MVSKTENKFYLTGWEGDSESGYLIITPDEAFLLTDSRYTEQAVAEAKGFHIIEVPGNFAPFLAEFLKEKGIERLGFESHDLSVFNHKRFKKFFKTKLIPVAHLIEEFRAVKDEEEINLLKQAVRLDEIAFDHILNFVRVGMTEAEVAWELEKKLKELGAQRMGWSPFIVAAGKNSSIPHYGNSREVKIQKGDILQLDFASVVGGYHSDTSRVIFVGRPTQDKIETYNLVARAQEIGEELIKPGITGEDVDRKVRGFLESKTKYFFRHGLGHGVGLEIHEMPKISPNGQKKLEVGNCFTVEPGIYQPGWGGIRLEDVVVLEESGTKVLTKATKELKNVTI